MKALLPMLSSMSGPSTGPPPVLLTLDVGVEPTVVVVFEAGPGFEDVSAPPALLTLDLDVTVEPGTGALVWFGFGAASVAGNPSRLRKPSIKGMLSLLDTAALPLTDEGVVLVLDVEDVPDPESVDGAAVFWLVGAAEALRTRELSRAPAMSLARAASSGAAPIWSQFTVRVDPAGACPDGVPEVPVVEVVPEEDDVPAEEVVPVVPVSALAGAAMATTVPPRAASPNVKTAAVLAMRVLIMWCPFLRATWCGWLRKRIKPGPQRSLNAAVGLPPVRRPGPGVPET